jgi:hypothetical protein
MTGRESTCPDKPPGAVPGNVPQQTLTFRKLLHVGKNVVAMCSAALLLNITSPELSTRVLAPPLNACAGSARLLLCKFVTVQISRGLDGNNVFPDELGLADEPAGQCLNDLSRISETAQDVEKPKSILTQSKAEVATIHNAAVGQQPVLA